MISGVSQVLALLMLTLCTKFVFTKSVINKNRPMQTPSVSPKSEGRDKYFIRLQMCYAMGALVITLGSWTELSTCNKLTSCHLTSSSSSYFPE